MEEKLQVVVFKDVSISQPIVKLRMNSVPNKPLFTNLTSLVNQINTFFLVEVELHQHPTFGTEASEADM